MGMYMKIVLSVLIMTLTLLVCSHPRHATSAGESMFTEFPEQINMCPKINIYKQSRVGVFRFSEPSYASGTGRAAAEAVVYDLIRRGVFSCVINEVKQGNIGTVNSMDLARSNGYDLIITGEVLNYFDGSELLPSSVNERIHVVHVPTHRILWTATAKSTAAPSFSTDFLLFQTKGEPAKPAKELLQRNAAKFSNMLISRPSQTGSADGSTDIFLSSHRSAIKGLQKQNDELHTQNDLLEHQLWKEIAEGEGLRGKLDDLSIQADQLEKQLREEIERGEITLKRYKAKTIINIDDSICFDSGSAVLKKGAKKYLAKISKTLKKFPDNNIRVEGHTDGVPIRSRKFSSNWELSSARALAVLRYLLDKSDISPGKLSATGYGKHHPIASNDSPENKRMNRRVDIVIVPSES